MKNNLLYITLIFALCFGFKVQAQSNQVKTLESKINTLTPREIKAFEEMITGQTSFVVVSEDNSIHFIEREGTVSKVILLEKLSSEPALKVSKYNSYVPNSEILLIDTRHGEDYRGIVNIDFDAYISLKTIVIITNNDIDMNELQRVVSTIEKLDRVEVLINKMETEI